MEVLPGPELLGVRATARVPRATVDGWLPRLYRRSIAMLLCGIAKYPDTVKSRRDEIKRTSTLIVNRIEA